MGSKEFNLTKPSYIWLDIIFKGKQLISVTPATVNDSEIISNIVYANCEKAFGEGYDPEKINHWISKWYSKEAVTERILDKNYSVIVAKLENKVIGTAYLKTDGYLGGMYVAARSQGAGREMFTFLMNSALSRGISTLTTETHATNEIVIYGLKLFGFKQIRMYEDDEFFPDTPFLVFAKNLKASTNS